jgi:hypothetical protein
MMYMTYDLAMILIRCYYDCLVFGKRETLRPRFFNRPGQLVHHSERTGRQLIDNLRNGQSDTALFGRTAAAEGVLQDQGSWSTLSIFAGRGKIRSIF